MRALVGLLDMGGEARCGGAHHLGHFLKSGGGTTQGIGFALGLKVGLLGLAQRLIGLGRLLSGCLRLALGIFYVRFKGLTMATMDAYTPMLSPFASPMS